VNIGHSISLDKMSDIRVGNIVAEQGTKKFGYVDVMQLPERPATTIRIPVTIVNGCNDGPVLCLTAGTHGCEYAGIMAVVRVCKQIRPEELKGAIIGVPVVNMPGFMNRTQYVNPLDKWNISHFDTPKGSISEIILTTLTEEIITKANYYVDCHGGDLQERAYETQATSVTYFKKVGKADIDTKSEAMSRVYDVGHIVQAPKGWADRLAELAKKGIPSIVGEIGGLGIFEATDIDRHIGGITNILKYLRMIRGDPIITIKQMFADGQFYVKANRSGLYCPKVRPGDLMSKGQIVATVENLRGEVLEEVTAPQDGMARIMYTYGLVDDGDVLMLCLTKPRTAGPFPETDRFYKEI